MSGVTPQRERVWIAVGGVAAIGAAVLAYVDEPWSRAALAAEIAILVTGSYLLLSRKLERVRRTVAPLNARSRQTAKELKRANREIARVRGSIDKLQVAQDKKIALAVERIDEKVAAHLSREAAGIKTVIKDTEIESGLAALNRYTSLAEQQSDPEGSASDA